MEYGLRTGGPVIMLVSFVFVGIFTILVGSSLAEICSAYPVAGGIYYWSGALAKRKDSPFYSYIAGWILFSGYISGLTSLSYSLAKIIAGFIDLKYVL